MLQCLDWLGFSIEHGLPSWIIEQQKRLYNAEAELYQAVARRYPFQVYYCRKQKAFEVVESSPEGEPVSTGLVDARRLG